MDHHSALMMNQDGSQINSLFVMSKLLLSCRINCSTAATQQPPPHQQHNFPMSPTVSQQPYSRMYTISQQSEVVVGNCPTCRVGVLEDDFSCLGILTAILCAIFFFPLGILFIFAVRQRRCPSCGTTFS
uniref:Membrane protein BRI3 n=1 Tax=Acanthochromis polyacanthus TaxID=80966 RepID=A0A3Q1GGW2_9TELE